MSAVAGAWTVKESAPNESRSCLTPPVSRINQAGWNPTPDIPHNIERTIDLNEWLIGNELATFIVRAEGDSMTGEIHSGDRLIVDRSLEARHRDVVVACIDGEMIVKRLLVRDGRYYLQPENTSYPLIEITGERELIIWGVVTHSIHPLR